MSGLPDNRWCFAVQLAEDLLNLRALKSLDWQNAYQATLGETRDISPYFQFKLWDKITYTNPGVTFPQGKHLPGRWLGVSHHVGDMLTYKVEPEKEHWGRYVVIDRSAIHFDDGTNARIKEVRGKCVNDNSPKTGVVWKEPLDMPCDNLGPLDDNDPEEPEKRLSSNKNKKPLLAHVPTLDQEDIYGAPPKPENSYAGDDDSSCGSMPGLIDRPDDDSSVDTDSSW